MSMIRVELKNRYSNACQWAGTIEDQGEAAKNMGAAVEKALADGAVLTDADLTRAVLRGADLPNGYRIAHLDFGGWLVTVTPEHTTIWCQRHANAGWLEWTPESPKIARMHHDAPTWWARHCEAVRAVIRDVMQP